LPSPPLRDDPAVRGVPNKPSLARGRRARPGLPIRGSSRRRARASSLADEAVAGPCAVRCVETFGVDRRDIEHLLTLGWCGQRPVLTPRVNAILIRRGVSIGLVRAGGEPSHRRRGGQPTMGPGSPDEGAIEAHLGRLASAPPPDRDLGAQAVLAGIVIGGVRVELRAHAWRPYGAARVCDR
jgi:hypothetical protein